MAIPELILQEYVEQNDPLEKRFRELLDIEVLSGPELKELQFSDLPFAIKRNRDTIQKLKQKPYSTAARILTNTKEGK